MYLPEENWTCFSAWVGGYDFEAQRLNGFSDWVREQTQEKGPFVWEMAILREAQFRKTRPEKLFLAFLEAYFGEKE